ncbi:MAG TPA: Crp/Fnr family transcriptional regulator [Ilumatobacter sp.]|jgi:CRP-like cAMP-binding protein|nr:Crp/Fnr family transcriptional regulator [Ilumatobacter sp.]
MSADESATFLAALAEHERTALLTAGRRRRFATGAWIIPEGDGDRSVFVIERGSAKVTSVTLAGSEMVCAVESAGSLVGHWEAVEPARFGRNASVVALEPVECREISRAEFLDLLERNPGVAVELLRLTIRTLRSVDRRRPIPERADTPPRRLARLLVDCVSGQDVTHHIQPATQSVDVGLALTQQEMAGMIGTSRASIVRALGVLRREGIVSTSPRRLVVNDLAGLRAMAE